MKAVRPGSSWPEQPLSGQRRLAARVCCGGRWRRAVAGALAALTWIIVAAPVRAQLEPDQVLVLYNSQGPDTQNRGISDSQAIYEYYSERRPGVRGLDLNDPTLLPGSISYADYVSKIRDPLRQYLSQQQLESHVVAFTLTRGLPHRILDINSSTIGDDPSAASARFDQRNITYASVDSELTLLWQDLHLGEQGNRFDSRADQMVLNPYHNREQSIANFDRGSITQTRAFEDIRRRNTAWRMHNESVSGELAGPGAIYLSSRLDGHSVQDVKRMIDRARLPSYSSAADAIILDESPPGDLDDMGALEDSSVGHLGDDYQNTYQSLTSGYQRLILEESSGFITGSGSGYTGTAPAIAISGNVAALVSYGGNHDRGTGSATNDGYLQSFAGQWVDGAVMNTAESYNARALGGLPAYADQGQLADFIAQGGTFGIGNVWEPFAFSLADNQVLLDRLLKGQMSWVEAAWSSIPWLSWQQVVLGDPLARVAVIDDPQTARWQLPATAQATDGHSWDAATNWNRQSKMQVPRPGDDLVFSDTGESTVRLEVGGDRIVESLRFEGNYWLSDGQIAVRSGRIEVTQDKTVTVVGELANGRGLTKTGLGRLRIDGRAGALHVQQGGLGVQGELVEIVVGSRAMLEVLGPTRVDEQVVLDRGARLHLHEPVGSESASLHADQRVELSGTAVLDAAILDQIAEDRGRRDVLLSITSDQSVTGGISEVDASGSIIPLGDGRPVHVMDGLFLVLHRGPQHWSLERRVALPGDTDGDTDVDSLDLTAVTLGWTGSDAGDPTNRQWLQGDFDQDGDVDAADLTGTIIQWTGSAASAAPRVVPEPAGWAAAAVAWIGLVMRRRRSRRAEVWEVWGQPSIGGVGIGQAAVVGWPVRRCAGAVRRAKEKM